MGINLVGKNSASGEVYNGLGVEQDQIFISNYWIEQNEFDIKQKIQDGNVYFVLVSPFLPQPVQASGF